VKRLAFAIAAALAACATTPEPDRAYGVCLDESAPTRCHCYDGFRTAVVTEVACDQEALELCDSALDNGECVEP
jgi:uncharacterized lipoprotein YmbA